MRLEKKKNLHSSALIKYPWAVEAKIGMCANSAYCDQNFRFSSKRNCGCGGDEWRDGRRGRCVGNHGFLANRWVSKDCSPIHPAFRPPPLQNCRHTHTHTSYLALLPFQLDGSRGLCSVWRPFGTPSPITLLTVEELWGFAEAVFAAACSACRSPHKTNKKRMKKNETPARITSPLIFSSS